MFSTYTAWKKLSSITRTALIDFGPSWPEVRGKIKGHHFCIVVAFDFSHRTNSEAHILNHAEQEVHDDYVGNDR